MADAEVQTGAERVVRSNVGRCPRVRVLIPPLATFRTRYYPPRDPRPPTLLPPLVTNAWLELWSEAWNNIEFIIRSARTRYNNSRDFIFFAQEYFRLSRMHSRSPFILNEYFNIISSHVRKSRNCDAFPLQFLSFLSFPLLYSNENDSVIVQMTEITWTRACFSLRPLNIVHVPPMHLSVFPWPFLIIRFLRLLVICIRARGCNWDALHSRLAMISPVKICCCYYPEYKPI